MKAFKIVSLFSLCMSITALSFAQDSKSETIPVSGNCGMCKSTIEKAAKQAGASEAEWNKDTKKLTIRYSSSSTNAAKIQQTVAAAGYDTRDVKADDAAYNKLHSCCKYERVAVKDTEKPAASVTTEEKASCCSKEAAKETASGKEKSCCSEDKKDCVKPVKQ